MIFHHISAMIMVYIHKSCIWILSFKVGYGNTCNVIICIAQVIFTYPVFLHVFRHMIRFIIFSLKCRSNERRFSVFILLFSIMFHPDFLRAKGNSHLPLLFISIGRKKYTCGIIFCTTRITACHAILTFTSYHIVRFFIFSL